MNIEHNKGDLLSDQEIYRVCGVDPEKRAATKKVMNVLDAANIFYWLKDDGSIGTTWHHIHSAKKQACRPATLDDQDDNDQSTFTPDFKQAI